MRKFVICVTALAAMFTDHAIRALGQSSSWRPQVKTLLTAIAVVIAIVFTSQAFAADLPDCPKTTWKNGHYVCGDIEANS
jgi:hypothetical protein